MTYTIHTIPIVCGECETMLEGIDPMRLHILHDHPDYTVNEAVLHAAKWAEDAFERVEEQEVKYHIDRKQEDRND